MLGYEGRCFSEIELGSFYLWIAGAIFFLFSLFATGLDTGWTFYTPYSIESQGPVIAATLGVFHSGFQFDFHRVEFHRDDQHDATTRDDLVPHAVVPLGGVLDVDYPGTCDSSSRDHHAAVGSGKAAWNRYFRFADSMVIRSPSSISFGSIRTRLFTS